MLSAFLSRSDVTRHLQALLLLRELRAAFSAGLGTAVPGELGVEGPALAPTARVQRATLPGLPAWAVTVGTPGHALLQLHDARTGGLLAMMDAVHLQTLRASLVSALAADVLARDDAKTVAVLGNGLAASGALKALRLVRSLTRVWMFEPDLAANTELTVRLQQALSTSVRGVDTAEEAVAEADLVVLTGGVALPADAVKAGAHVTVLGADPLAPAPLPAALLARARRFADTRTPALPWLESPALLGEVLAGTAVGRQDAAEVTVFVAQGPATQDLVAAWHVYERARHDEAVTRFDLES